MSDSHSDSSQQRPSQIAIDDRDLIEEGSPESSRPQQLLCSLRTFERELQVEFDHQLLGRIRLCGRCALCWNLVEIGQQVPNNESDDFVDYVSWFIRLLRRVFRSARPAPTHTVLARPDRWILARAQIFSDRNRPE